MRCTSGPAYEKKTSGSIYVDDAGEGWSFGNGENRELGPRFFVSAPTSCITVSWLLPLDADRFLVPRTIDNIEMFDPVPSQPIARVRASQHAAVLQLADFSRARSGASKPSIQRRVSAARHIQSEIEQRTAMLAREGGGRCPF